jgi:hypothetical protein
VFIRWVSKTDDDGLSARAYIPLAAQDVDADRPPWPPATTYGDCQHATCTGSSVGNHRLRITADPTPGATVLRIDISWRRKDNISTKDVVAQVGQLPLHNFAVVDMTLLNASFVLDATEAARLQQHKPAKLGTLLEILVYYMPYQYGPMQWGENVEYDYCSGTPAAPEHYNNCTADPSWLARARSAWRSLPACNATVVFEPRRPFDAFTDMEHPATEREIADDLRRYPDASCNDQLQGHCWRLFPEQRDRSVRMRQFPFAWIGRCSSNIQCPITHVGMAAKAEAFAFQVGVFSAKARLSIAAVVWSDLVGRGSSKIDRNLISCLNTEGRDNRGQPFTIGDISVEAGVVKSLWFSVMIPVDAAEGDYLTNITVLDSVSASSQVATIQLSVNSSSVKFGGVADGWRLARLDWLNSNAGITDLPSKQYSSIVRSGSGSNLTLSSCTISLTDAGLPASIRVGPHKAELLSGPVRFEAVDQRRGAGPLWSDPTLHIGPVAADDARWSSHAVGSAVSMNVQGCLEADGYANFNLSLSCSSSTGCSLADARLVLPLNTAAVPLMMGMGRRGGQRPKDGATNWHWTAMNRSAAGAHSLAQHMVWLGDVSHGLRLKLKDPGVEWDSPAHEVFSDNVPKSWAGKICAANDTTSEFCGGVTLTSIDQYSETVDLVAFSGPQEFDRGETLSFFFDVYITPSRPIDTSSHFDTRYYQMSDRPYLSVAEMKKKGITVANVHQGNELNPYINYPFYANEELDTLAQSLHSQGCKLKLYYTTGFISIHSAELHVLRQLGHEILAARGPNDPLGSSWEQEHFEPAELIANGWSTPGYCGGPNRTLHCGLLDAALRAQGGNTDPSASSSGWVRGQDFLRYDNFYVEGVQHLNVNNSMRTRFDGMYLRRARPLPQVM